MFNKNARQLVSARSLDIERQYAAISRSQAVIEFELDGTVITANQNFCDFTGYALSEVQGRHHSMFMDPAEAATEEYRAFWRRLNAGEFVAAKFRRLVRGGREVWIQACYNPVLDEAGRPVKVMKVATDITAAEREHLAKEAERQRTEQLQADMVAALAEGLGRLSKGDMAVQIDRAFEGSYAAIRDNFNGAVTSLRAALVKINQAIGPLSSGADEIASATDNLSRRTEQQASSLEQTVAALDQLTATVKRSAEGAKDASEVASHAKDEALKSGEVVREAVGAMGEIEQSSGRISQIIGVIDEIAFQTNLLALNAGVEAARAGDAGRGFAVVAQEVRELAQRSASAAREIKGLIASSAVHVEKGVSLVGATGEALTGLVQRAGQIDTLISEIAVSAREQSTGLHEVNTAMNQMDQMTQQNASMVEETTAAVTQLNDQAVELASLIAQFHVGRGPAPVQGRTAGGAQNPVRELRRRVGAAAADWR